MKIWKCDMCGKEKSTEKYPKEWFLIRIYKKAQVKGGNSKGYHCCEECKEKKL